MTEPIAEHPDPAADAAPAQPDASDVPAAAKQMDASGGELPAGSDAPQARLTDVIDEHQVRRAPRFGSFVGIALLLAFVLCVSLSFVRDAMLPAAQVQARALDSWGAFWVLFAFFGPVFVLLGYGVAVWLDRRSVRRHRSGAGQS